jgi:hypothetical protein
MQDYRHCVWSDMPKDQQPTDDEVKVVKEPSDLAWNFGPLPDPKEQWLHYTKILIWFRGSDFHMYRPASIRLTWMNEPAVYEIKWQDDDGFVLEDHLTDGKGNVCNEIKCWTYLMRVERNQNESQGVLQPSDVS